MGRIPSVRRWVVFLWREGKPVDRVTVRTINRRFARWMAMELPVVVVLVKLDVNPPDSQASDLANQAGEESQQGAGGEEQEELEGEIPGHGQSFPRSPCRKGH